MEARPRSLEPLNKQSMTEFTSEIKVIPHSRKVVYETLSDLNNLESKRADIPEDKITEFELTADSVSFSANPFGKLTIRIVEKEPDSSIKFAADGLPIEANLWINLNASGENETEMQALLVAELNPFIKGVVSKPLQKAVDKIADILSQMPFE